MGRQAQGRPTQWKGAQLFRAKDLFLDQFPTYLTVWIDMTKRSGVILRLV